MMFRGEDTANGTAVAFENTLYGVRPRAPDLWCFPCNLDWRIEGAALDYSRLSRIRAVRDGDSISLFAEGMPRILAHAMSTGLVLSWFRTYLGQDDLVLLHRQGNAFTRHETAVPLSAFTPHPRRRRALVP